MSPKIHPFEKFKSTKFNEYKLLDKIDMLADIMDQMNTRPQVRQISKTHIISLTFIEAEVEVTETILVMTEAEETSDKGHMMETEEDILHSEVDPDSRRSDRRQDNYRDRGDNRQQRFRCQSHLQLEDLELHQGLLAELKTDVSVVDKLVILPKNVLRRRKVQRMSPPL